MSLSFVRILRCSLVWSSATALLMGGAWLLAQDFVRTLGEIRIDGLAGQSFETLLVWLCTCAATACCAWLWMTSTAVILGIALDVTHEGPRRTRRGRPRGCPDLVRRAVLIACGVAVVGSMGVPAQASSSDTDRRPSSTKSVTILAGLPLPERTVRDTSIAHTPQARVVPTVQSAKAPALVRVEAGDTLWGIAARTLGPDASNSAVSARWHSIYELNRAAIGADPDLILPGQHLRLTEA